MANDITTIKLNRKTKERLSKFRIYKRETYDELINKILNILNIAVIEPQLARVKLIKINKERKTAERLNLNS